MLLIVIILALFNVLLMYQLDADLMSFSDIISEEEARSIAIQYNPDRKITQVAPRRLNKNNYYEVSFSDDTKVLLDADSGSSSLEGETTRELVDPAERFEEYLEDALFIVNIVILLLAPLLSYFLAGKALASLEESVWRQKKFVSDATHELSNIMTSIYAAADHGLQKKRLSSQQSHEILQSILHESLRLSTLNEYLLRLLYMTSAPPDFRKINLASIIKKVQKSTQALADKKQISLNFHVKSFSRLFNSELMEIMVNLLVANAISMSPVGSEVELSLSHHGVLSVQDFGIGIASQHISNIFETEHTANIHDFSLGGAGLGLSIIREIARIHDAEVVISSNIGRGSVFKILL